MRRLLVVDDDAEMSRMLAEVLSVKGYKVDVVTDMASALSVVLATPPDLVLLDVGLGDEDGRDLLRELRMVSDVPVVFVTGRGHEIDRIAGLKMGADDYVVKPFSMGELEARIGSVLRRSRPSGPPRSASLDFGWLAIDTVAREVEVAGKLVDFTAKEFDLLAFFASSPRQVFSRGQLLDSVWSSSSEWQTEATVTEHVRRIRSKIEPVPDQPRMLMTVRGVGYRFEPRAGQVEPERALRARSA